MNMIIKAKKGFTLVELLVAIALFSIVIVIAVGAFTNALRTQRQVAALIAAQSNASLALEQLAREVRTGYLFCHNTLGGSTCSPDCTTQGAVTTCPDLDFWNAEETNVHYAQIDNALEKSENGQAGPFQPITGDSVKVQKLRFTIFGNEEGDHWTPRITISMGVGPSSTDPGVQGSIVNLQTTVSARDIDCTATNPPSC